MSEDKEILCPVCGERMKYRSSGQKYYACQTRDCLEEGVAYGLPKIEKGNALVNARIDRAVEEAVRKERERVEGCLESILVDAEQAEEYHRKVTSLSGEAYAWSQVISNLKKLRREISAT